MPIVLATDAPTLWESSYADIVGVQYEFPEQYRAYVLPGERFLYYRGTRGASRGPRGYFGEGIIGRVGPSPSPGKLIAQVHDTVIYENVVDIRDSRGNYWETGSTRGTNWANGVRRIPDRVFTEITAVASGGPSEETDAPAPTRRLSGTAEIERYAINVAIELLGTKYGASNVVEMPVNNPGFDLEVHQEGQDPLHVEVKGTVLPAPVFHLSEGQRRHAERLRERFLLVVVYQINAVHRTHEICCSSGPLTPEKADLRPNSWVGLLKK